MFVGVVLRSDRVSRLVTPPRAMRLFPHVFTFVWACDSPRAFRSVVKLRNEESQEALAELAACPLMHLAATMDHINAPLMWDVGLAEKFNWVRFFLVPSNNTSG